MDLIKLLLSAGLGGALGSALTLLAKHYLDKRLTRFKVVHPIEIEAISEACKLLHRARRHVVGHVDDLSSNDEIDHETVANAANAYRDCVWEKQPLFDEELWADLRKFDSMFRTAMAKRAGGGPGKYDKWTKATEALEGEQELYERIMSRARRQIHPK